MASKIKVDELETADGSGTIALQNQLSGMTSASMPTGSVLQVVSVTNSSHETTTNSSSFVAHSGLVASITPSSTSSKIFVTTSFSYGTPGGTNNFNATLYRGSTNLGHSTYGFGTMFGGSSYVHGHTSLQILDSPSTTSSTTYQLYFKGTTTARINNDGSTGSITLMEIKG
jgi:hypothetical protein